MVFRCLFCFVGAFALSAVAQEPAGALTSASVAPLQPRKLAPGALTIVPAVFDREDVALGPYDLELVNKFPELAWTAPTFSENKPNFGSPQETLVELSKNVTFRPERIWGLEFAFKPVRTISVELPEPTGKLSKQTAHYLVFAVRNPGKAIRSVDTEATDDASIKVTDVPAVPIRTLTRFQIVSKERQFMADSSIQPIVKAAIEAKERVGKPLLDQIQLSQTEISPDGKPVWGVAIWMNVDPTADYFAVDVRGLTNAYRMKEETTGEVRYERKTLRIFHWRAGDEIDQGQDRIRLGIPAYDGPGAKESERLKLIRSELLQEIQSIKEKIEEARSTGQAEVPLLAAQIPELQERITRLNIALRQQDALDNFNLTERLDYQWVYR